MGPSGSNAPGRTIRRVAPKINSSGARCATSSSGDGPVINRRTPANVLIANSSDPHVILNEAASRRHAYFAAQFSVHVRQPCGWLIALAYGWNVSTAFALRQTSMLSDIGY